MNVLFVLLVSILKGNQTSTMSCQV